ncbi:MAG: phosphatidylglycerophosphatase A [Synergistaceae bacterium]
MELNKEMKTWYGLIATFGTIGRYTKMPGTIGSIIACAIWITAKSMPAWVIIAVAIIGTIAADKYEKKSGHIDPSEVIIDEVIGCWISCFGFGLNYSIVALFLFRIIDISKPFPVKQMEKLPGGLGIMADDVIGGVIVNLLIRALQWLYLANGFKIIAEMIGM